MPVSFYILPNIFSIFIIFSIIKNNLNLNVLIIFLPFLKSFEIHSPSLPTNFKFSLRQTKT